MKKLITFLIFIGFAVASYGQAYHNDGAAAGPKSSRATDSFISRWVVDDDLDIVTFYSPLGHVLTPAVNAGAVVNLFDYAARKYLVDTALITATTYTMQATDAGKVLWFSHATYCEVTIPQNTLPAGSIVTMWRTGGPVRVNGGAGVVRKSYLDSCTMNSLNVPYQVEFRTTNKPYLIGRWED